MWMYAVKGSVFHNTIPNSILLWIELKWYTRILSDQRVLNDNGVITQFPFILFQRLLFPFTKRITNAECQIRLYWGATKIGTSISLSFMKQIPIAEESMSSVFWLAIVFCSIWTCWMIHLGLVLSEGVSVKDVEAVQVCIHSYVLRRRTARKQGMVLPFKQIVVICLILYNHCSF